MLRRIPDGIQDPYRILLGSNQAEKETKRSKNPIIGIVIMLLVSLLISLFAISPPLPAKETYVTIEEGDTVRDIAQILKKEKLIRSEQIFIFMSVLLGYDKTFVSGTYFFQKPQTVFTLIQKIGDGEHGVKTVSVTIPEGLSRHEITAILEKTFPKFSREDFMFLSRDDEGYLFPDTYTFFITATSEEIYERMRRNFSLKTEELQMLAEGSSLTFHEVLTLASIVEEEAASAEDRKIVAGIFLERMKQNMPLQADATFQYINGKASLELTLEDLEEDSPYNTYTNKGLPPTPIVSPGIESISAVLSPTRTSYLFYLSDKSGKIHYARTFEEHKTNRSRYLNK